MDVNLYQAISIVLYPTGIIFIANKRYESDWIMNVFLFTCFCMCGIMVKKDLQSHDRKKTTKKSALNVATVAPAMASATTFNITLCSSHSSTFLARIKVKGCDTVADIKKITAKHVQFKPECVALRLIMGGKDLSNNQMIYSLSAVPNFIILVKYLGPQIGYKISYLVMYGFPAVLIAAVQYHYATSMNATARLTADGLFIHFAKRFVESYVVHSFSRTTMPLTTAVRNIVYYVAFIAYVITCLIDPDFKIPSMTQVYVSMAVFMVCQLGNLAVHINFKNLRPVGTTIRKTPTPDWNPFTKLFTLVSCPNYTYECGSWVALSLMINCAGVHMWTLTAIGTMSYMAYQKHRKYCETITYKQFGRKAIFPYIL